MALIAVSRHSLQCYLAATKFVIIFFPFIQCLCIVYVLIVCKSYSSQKITQLTQKITTEVHEQTHRYWRPSLFVPSTTSTPFSLGTRNFSWDCWAVGFSQSSTPTVNGQSPTGAKLFVSQVFLSAQSLLFDTRNVAETAPSLQQNQGMTSEKERSRKSTNFNSQTGQVDFLIRSFFILCLHFKMLQPG